VEVNLLLVETGKRLGTVPKRSQNIKIGNFCNFQFFLAVFLFIYLVIILASKSKEGENIEKGF